MDAGTLTIRARRIGQHVANIAVRLQRPAVSRLFVGQPAAVVVRTVPRLYSLCAEAQRSAAAAALAAALGQTAALPDAGALWSEFIHESLWRLLLDWPLALGLAPEKAAFIAWRGARHGTERIAATQAVLAGPLAALSEKCLVRLGDHAREGDAGLPLLAPADWLPCWQGEAAMLPELPRPASLAGAYRDRLAGLHLAFAALAADSPCPVAAAGGDGWGVGQVLTARGVLTHALRVDAGKVSEYAVWAPTDRHFADGAGLAALLAGVVVGDDDAARQALAQAVLALDPCLPYVMEIEHA